MTAAAAMVAVDELAVRSAHQAATGHETRRRRPWPPVAPVRRRRARESRCRRRRRRRAPAASRQVPRQLRHPEHLDADVQTLESRPVTSVIWRRRRRPPRRARRRGRREAAPTVTRPHTAARRVKNSTSVRSTSGWDRPAAEEAGRRGPRGHEDAAGAGRRGQPEGIGVVAQHEPDEAGDHDHTHRQDQASSAWPLGVMYENGEKSGRTPRLRAGWRTPARPARPRAAAGTSRSS